MTSHLDLTDRDQEDHPKYGPLAAANQWSDFNFFSDSLRAVAASVGDITPILNSYLAVGTGTYPSGKAALVIRMGMSVQPPLSSVTGIVGRCVSNNPANNAIYGLSLQLGALNSSLASISAFRSDIMAVGGSLTLASATHFRADPPFVAVATITALYGFFYALQTDVLSHRPIYDTNPPTNAAFSLHRSTLQLFGASPSFGGGAGVLGVANATVVPSSNPTVGGILYASGGALYWRGSSGSVTLLAPA